MDYPRDLIGFAGEPPHPKWPGDARLALQFVINYEEGGERSILHGDGESEAFLSDITNASPIRGGRNMNVESCYEYGARAGFWRLHRMFVDRGIPVTVYGVAMALDRNPRAVEAMLKAEWEIATHGYRWINYQDVPESVEWDHLKQAIDVHTRVTGQRPTGWYLGRCSSNTHRLVSEEGGFLYNSDTYADDLPYWDTFHTNPQLMIPYTTDVNDMRFATTPGFNSGDEFFNYLKDNFDLLYEEGETAPKMMSVGLHCRLVGRPARAAALARFLDYVQKHEKVWMCRRIEIAEHWMKHHPKPEVAHPRVGPGSAHVV